MAYVPQQAWIQNSTFKENITFGEPSKGFSYDEIVDACALKADLKILPAGDQTEIGEKVDVLKSAERRLLKKSGISTA